MKKNKIKIGNIRLISYDALPSDIYRFFFRPLTKSATLNDLFYFYYYKGNFLVVCKTGNFSNEYIVKRFPEETLEEKTNFNDTNYGTFQSLKEAEEKCIILLLEGFIK